jgi:hypothetical protein
MTEIIWLKLGISVLFSIVNVYNFQIGGTNLSGFH